MRDPDARRLRRHLRRVFADLPRRAWLTLRYHGGRETARRVLTFPLRLTPLGARLGIAARMDDPSAAARAWYRAHGRRTLVIVEHRDDRAAAARTAGAVARSSRQGRVRVALADGARACGRALADRAAGEDVVLLRAGAIPDPGWLEVLQHAVHVAARPGTVLAGPRLLDAAGRIASAGLARDPRESDRFHARFAGRPADFAPACVLQPSLAVEGACLYASADGLAALGTPDPAMGPAADVDLCLRAWSQGLRVVYAPAATVTVPDAGPADAAAPQHRVPDRWRSWFDRSAVADADGRLSIVYVTQGTELGGGHRVAFDHLNGLAARGHRCELWTLATDAPDWYALDVPVRCFSGYDELTDALAPVDAIKVATWWQTAAPVWEASVSHGVPVFFVQDVETSYYPRDLGVHAEVLTSYRPEFSYLATSGWVHDALREWVASAARVAPGVDTATFRELADVARRDAEVLAVGRANPLKNFPLTRAAWLALPEPRPALQLFGVEPEVADGLPDGVDYAVAPSDAEVNVLLNRCAVFLQTSRHEGFCLPILEAMAAGAPVVCVDAHGNRDYCVDGENCLQPPADAAAVSAAIERVLGDAELRARLVEGGRRTAAPYARPRKLEEVAAFFGEVAALTGTSTSSAATS